MTKRSTKLEWALNYLAYCVHVGTVDGSDLDGISDEELIKLADHMENKADEAWDAWKERFT